MDKRLIGTWRSDKRRTLHELRMRGDATAEYVAFMSRILGKLTIEYRRTTMVVSGIGDQRRVHYVVLGSDAESVVLQTDSDILGSNALTHIFFDGTERYWVPVSGKFREWFRRVG